MDVRTFVIGQQLSQRILRCLGLPIDGSTNEARGAPPARRRNFASVRPLFTSPSPPASLAEADSSLDRIKMACFVCSDSTLDMEVCAQNGLSRASQPVMRVPQDMMLIIPLGDLYSPCMPGAPLLTDAQIFQVQEFTATGFTDAEWADSLGHRISFWPASRSHHA